MIKIKTNDSPLYLCNAYAPNSENDIILFLNNLSSILADLDTDKLILCGDFNSVMDNTFDIVSGEPHSETKVTAFQNFSYVNNLFDTWRLFNSNDKDFTWSRLIQGKLIARRLDYIFTTDSVLDNCLECHIFSFPNTDHRGVILKLKSSECKRGPGTWKINNSLLKEQTYLDIINELIEDFEKDNRYSNLDGDIRWDLLKLKIKDETINYSKARAVRKRNDTIQLQLKLDSIDELLAQYPDKTSFIQAKQQTSIELELLEQEKTRSAQIRAREKWREEGDKNTKFFLGLEKTRANAKIIPCLELDDNSVITDQFEILRAQKEYYEQLYKLDCNVSENCEEDLDRFLENTNVPTLNGNERNSCEGMVTLEELGVGLKELKNGSSPGLDGLSTEFIKVFWGKLGKHLLLSFTASFQKGHLSYSQNSAMITLIHKGKDLSKTKLSHWRPISLTNTDYKILAKTLAMRVMGVIDSIVGKDQCAYIKGRNISDNLKVIDDIIEYLKFRDKPGLLLAIDFSKAFDSISRKFMITAFRKFGFGPEFIKWVEVLMHNNRSSIGYNGWVSGDFCVERGIRQGCPFSPLAFIIGIEYLALKIRQSVELEGIKIGNELVEKLIKILLYADDVTMFLKDRNELLLAITILDQFKTISGLTINRTKSEVMWLGSNIYQRKEGLGLRWVDETKILGIIFSNRIQASCNEKNWKDRLEKIKRIICQWEKRNLSLFGKICIIKSFLASQLIYGMKALVLPHNVLLEINRLFFRFLWRKTNCNRKAFEKVKRNVMISEIESGGLKMVDITLLQQSFQLEWVSRLYKEVTDAKWTWIPNYYCKISGLNLNILNSTIGTKQFKGLGHFFNTVWNNHFCTWLQNNKTSTINRNIKSQCIWNNDKIRYQNNVLFFKEIATNGINFVSDLLINNRIMSFRDFRIRLNNYPNLFLQYTVLHNALTNYIRNYNLDTDTNEPPLLYFNDNSFHSAKNFRQYLATQNYSKPTSDSLWQRKFSVTLDKKHWLLAFNSTKESRLRELHFKILHNIYPTNILLSKIGITNSNKCSYCPDYVDYVEHFFFECPRTNRVWKCVQDRFFLKYNRHIILTPQEAILGIENNATYSKDSLMYMNKLILIAKMCIGIYHYGTSLDIKLMFE